MLTKIYPLIIQHSQPPSLGLFPSLLKRRKNLLRKLPQRVFCFFFLNQEFLYQCINHKNDHHFNSFLWVNSFKLSCQLEVWVGSPFGGKVRIIPLPNTLKAAEDQNYSGTAHLSCVVGRSQPSLSSSVSTY